MIAHFVLAGQSNLDQWFHADGGAALEAFRETFLTLNPGYSDVQFFDAARGGSAILGASAADYADRRAPDDPDLHSRISQNHWYDETTGSAGPNLALFTSRLEAEVAKGTEFLGVIWAQGEADTTYLSTNSAEGYTTGLDYVLQSLMAASGAGRTYIQALGDRAFYDADLHGGTQAVRDAQQELADGSDTITLATTIFDLDLRDSVHLTSAAYETAARRMATAIATEETSPSVGEAMMLNPSTLLIQFDLAPGQRFAGNISLGGFTLTDAGEEVAITSVSVTAGGLLRVETATALADPRLSYASAQDSVTMRAGDYIYVDGANGAVPVLPFDLTLSSLRQIVQEIPGGLRIDSGRLSDHVIGLSGDDALFGHGGHDTLIGGWGQDTLTGGAGKDVFVLGADMRMDTVTDFNLNEDAIGLMSTSMEGIRFTGTGDLEIETTQGQRIRLEGVDAEAADQVLFHMLGTEGDNLLAGWEGEDRIFAHGGDDTIDSGAGTDRITTGDGADVIRFGTGYGTNVVYDFDLARDRIELTDLQVTDLRILQYKGTDLELRTGSGDRLVLRNIALSDSGSLDIIGPPPTTGILTGTSGNDVLRGTALDEFFESFAGTDRLYGGAGTDVFDFRAGASLNIVYDFEDGQDRILIDAEDFDTLNLLNYKDTDAEIRLDSGDRLVLRNVDIADITADDFIFQLPEVFA